MRMKLFSKQNDIVKEYIKKNKLLIKNDRVVIGLSGGPDSICLFSVLLELRKELNLTLVAVHINHGIREEAGEDEKFVKILCEENQVLFKVFHEDVKKYQRKEKLSEEEAGRILRKKNFQKICEEEGCNKIALGHHKNDNAETLLFNLARGTGLKGMGGMKPMEGKYIRPLLCLEKKEILDYLDKKNLFYCEDRTNHTDDYTRNKIRNHIMNYMEEEINVKAVAHIAGTMEKIQKTNDFLEELTNQYMEKVEKNDRGLFVTEDFFNHLPEVMKEHVLYESLVQVCGEKKDITSFHVYQLEELFAKKVGRKIDLPYGVEAQREYKGILVGKPQKVKAAEEPVPNISMRTFSREDAGTEFPGSHYTKWFDYDIIKNKIEIRHRKQGDKIALYKDKSSKKLKDYFINEKIPREERDKLWLICDGEEVMWILGNRQSKAYQINENTKKVLEITVK
ncbi:tRNA(Ile)-lysidine synthase [Aequitasia blattaphilus]|uniref:tRNA(Ile)-lysidine synthase n=1 Tax=Aequitasia blattaphilus TaxID=2949332 RepID=A0ABT1E9R3_9FIRM|nr:tRNA lysidine(34) synthetase TilS [Aequitasia blattaphilus]MCP1102571.1 tRNA lysidine(34) synthetase TilS [Aequitasia blattaphilus]MCR8615211.1 tRNA lysidine(34) synthetase TilS [Aequitasia blattaphilus]